MSTDTLQRYRKDEVVTYHSEEEEEAHDDNSSQGKETEFKSKIDEACDMVVSQHYNPSVGHSRLASVSETPIKRYEEPKAQDKISFNMPSQGPKVHDELHTTTKFYEH